ncbi:hypothetical protein NC652_011652 [Populus alba x Populus x berolinensis]|nr:hypothetical protein NC652_011652 [Populus alba x Populus x berolinensis]
MSRRATWQSVLEPAAKGLLYVRRTLTIPFSKTCSWKPRKCTVSKPLDRWLSHATRLSLKRFSGSYRDPTPAKWVVF